MSGAMKAFSELTVLTPVLESSRRGVLFSEETGRKLADAQSLQISHQRHAGVLVEGTREGPGPLVCYRAMIRGPTRRPDVPTSSLSGANAIQCHI